MRFSPHFQLFYFNYIFVIFFMKFKIKKIDDGDLFSQLPLLIFNKGAN